jgi:hypothetical protein
VKVFYTIFGRYRTNCVTILGFALIVLIGFDQLIDRFDEGTLQLLSTINNTVEIIAGLMMYASEGYTIGSITALIPEASDASITGANIADGESGDVDFPYGSIKVLATIGERSVCESSTGTKLTGPPDGNGSMLKDDDTVRVFVQSESYGPTNEAKEET